MTRFPPSDPCYVVTDRNRYPVACLPDVRQAFRHWYGRGKLAIWRYRRGVWEQLISA